MRVKTAVENLCAVRYPAPLAAVVSLFAEASSRTSLEEAWRLFVCNRAAISDAFTWPVKLDLRNDVEHWALLFGHKSKRRFIWLDALGSPPPPALANAMQRCVEHPALGFSGFSVESPLAERKITVQFDSYQCGPWTAYFTRGLMLHVKDHKFDPLAEVSFLGKPALIKFIADKRKEYKEVLSREHSAFFCFSRHRFCFPYHSSRRAWRRFQGRFRH